MRQYAEAFRAEGLKVGFYFSLIDWHHPDYPAFTDADQPYRWGHWRRSSPEQWDRFIKVMFGQVRELLTNYGKIDLLWFDGGWERKPDEWKSAELDKMIRANICGPNSEWLRASVASDSILKFRGSVDLQMPVPQSSPIGKRQVGRGPDRRGHEAMPLVEAATGRGDRVPRMDARQPPPPSEIRFAS